MPCINPFEYLLITQAAQRDNDSLFPLPTALMHPPTVRQTIAALIGRGWVKARSTTDERAAAHTERGARFGVFITAEGRAAIHAAQPTERETRSLQFEWPD